MPGLTPVGWADLPGWAEDDHAEALRAFRVSAAGLAAAPPKTRGLGISAEALVVVAREALKITDSSRGAARAFFEGRFDPVEVRPDHGQPFFTGYFEPEVAASRRFDPDFPAPLYRRPDDLVDIDDRSRPAGMDPSFRFARLWADGGLGEYHDRGAIAAGVLAGRGLELAWLRDPVEAFFVHIQGSARLRLRDGGTMRVAYAAKSGHPYTAIGRTLIARGDLRREDISMASIREWLHAHPAEAPAVMASNRSFIFFRETNGLDPALGPVGAAAVQLTAGRSLAVDRTLHTFHTPVWVETAVPPSKRPFARLLIAQDTGSAIVGPGRGDIFFGSGDAAGEVAGAMQAEGRLVVLVPRGSPP